MADAELEAAANETRQIAGTLQELDNILGTDKLRSLSTESVAELRRSVRNMLISIRTDLTALEAIKRDDIYGTNPVFAGQKHVLIQRIETTKVDFEFDVVPAVEKLTKQMIEQVKQTPAALVDTSTAPSLPQDENWTVEKVVDRAEEYVDQASRAMSAARKLYTLVKALGLLIGISVS